MDPVAWQMAFLAIRDALARGRDPASDRRPGRTRRADGAAPHVQAKRPAAAHPRRRTRPSADAREEEYRDD